ncbi:MAG: hypothetical protein ACRD0L_03510, partial [Acidimicrobiales bacterium]
MNERRTSRGTTGGAGGDGGAGRLWARGRSLRVSAVAVAVGLLGLGSGLAGAVGAASAAASTTTPGFSVGSPVLTRTSTSAGATDVTYTATFLATHGLSVNASSTVTLVAPPGTVFPTNACDYQVGDVTTGQTNTFFCRPTLTGAGTAAITLTVDTSAGNGDQYAVTVEGVANPTSAASGTLSLSTSSDQTPVAVPDATAAATSVTTATLTRTSSSAGATDVTWVARFLATDGLSSAFTDPNADASTVTLAAPAGTVFPTNACDYQVRDVTTGQSNTFFCRPTLTGAGTATITLAVDTSAGPRDEYAVIVEGVANPTSAASGTLSLSTSSDPTPVSLADGTTAATAVTGAVLTRTSTAAGATDVTWVARFLATDGLSSAFTDPNADASTVTLAAPAGTVFPTNLCDYQVRDVTTGQSNTCPSRVTGAGTDTVTLAVSTPAGVGDDYSVTVTGVTNPTSAEPLHLSTSSDPEPVAVSDAPTQTGSVAPATLTRTSSSAGATETTYSVAFVATGGLTAGSSTVTLAGPSGTVFPTNGCALSVDLTTGQSSGCQPVSGGGSATAVVTVNTSAAPGDQYAMVVYGVANPTSAASGNLSL